MSVVSLVFAGAVLLLFKSFTAGSGYATNCEFVSISCSFVVILFVVIFVPRYSYLFFIFSRIPSRHLHIFVSKYLSIWELD